MLYLSLKFIHLISLVLLFGTGLGSAWYKWMADRSHNLDHITVVNRHVVLADWLFTTPTIMVQPITGILMVQLLGVPMTSLWLWLSVVLFLLAGACWLPVVWLQIRMRDLAQQAVSHKTALSTQYWRYARIWFWLGVPAFVAMVLVVFLMVVKPV